MRRKVSVFQVKPHTFSLRVPPDWVELLHMVADKQKQSLNLTVLQFIEQGLDKRLRKEEMDRDR